MAGWIRVVLSWYCYTWGKANAFVQQNAAVNRLSFDKTERSQVEILSIFNESFSKGVVPGIEKKANILPIKKAGTPPGDIYSY